MRYPNFEEEKLLWQKGFQQVVGLDEAGRGALAGPVVAAAVLIKKPILGLKPELKGINDSKKLSKKKREKFYQKINNHKQIKWGVGVVSEKIIDEINILEATKLAMKRALKNLRIKNKGLKIDYLLLDGNFTLNSIMRQKAVVHGDQKVISISAASVIAKVTRDKIMEKMHEKYPQYGFHKHKGYPTKLHRDILKKIGASPIHRKSFNF